MNDASETPDLFSLFDLDADDDLAPGALVPYRSSIGVVVNGMARRLSIYNMSKSKITNVGYTVSGLPAGTMVSLTPCSAIVAGAGCILTVTPGSLPTAAPGDVNSTPATITVHGDGVESARISVYVITIGSVYESGYVFAIDDSPQDFESVGGKAAALQDQATSPSGIIWSSDNGTVSHVDVQGITEISKAPPCSGATDGQCATSAIITWYTMPPAVPLADYAAGLCKGMTDGGYANWYLPAICELSYDGTGAGSGCGSKAAPTIPNLQSNLVELGNIGNFSSSLYWSSTEQSSAPASNAWLALVTSSGTQQETGDKGLVESVRCVRALATQ